VATKRAHTQAELQVGSIDANFSLKNKIYVSLKKAITSMNIYADDAELRLDERRLSEQLNISRTPVREALARLEQEGLVEIIARRGVYIVRKSKAEILEMITVWAALEGMAARLITYNATDQQIFDLREMLRTSKGDETVAHIDEYSERNIQFHQVILKISGCGLLRELADNLFVHVRSIRARTIGEHNRANRSIIDHTKIVEAFEKRDPELAERLVREHTLNLALHVEKYVDYLD